MERTGVVEGREDGVGGRGGKRRSWRWREKGRDRRRKGEDGGG